MDQVNNEVLKEIEKPLDEEELTNKIHFILNSNSNERKHKRLDHHHLYHTTPRQKFNEDMKKMSNLKTLEEFNRYIFDNDVRISPSNFFIDVLDPFPLPDENCMDEFNRRSKNKKKIANSKRRKNNSDSDDQIEDNKRNSSPESSSPDSQDANESGGESNSSMKNNIDGSSNSSFSNSSSYLF